MEDRHNSNLDSRKKLSFLPQSCEHLGKEEEEEKASTMDFLSVDIRKTTTICKHNLCRQWKQATWMQIWNIKGGDQTLFFFLLFPFMLLFIHLVILKESILFLITSIDRGWNHYMTPPKFNFSGIGHATNHYIWRKMTTFHSNPTYYSILVGSQRILPLCPFFHHTLYIHHRAFHFDPTIVGFYSDPSESCHYVHFFTTLCTNITMLSTLIPLLLDFTRIPLDLATPFNFFMYSHAYIF